MSQPWLWHVYHTHTSPQLSGCQPPHHGQGALGSQPPLLELVQWSPLLPLSPMGYATYIHPPLTGKWTPSAWHEENGGRWALLSPSRRPPAPRALHFSPRWPRRSCSCSQCANQACGSGRGAALPLPERRARAEGLASRCCRARRGLVGRLPVHPEAIDAGVLGVAPVSQDPQLHHLVRGHGRVLGRERRRQACRSPQTWQQAGGAMPPLGPDVPLPGSLQRTGSKAPVCSPRRRASSWWARQPQRLQTSYWGHPPSTT